MKNFYFIILACIVIVYILYSIRKNKISISSSFGWMMFCIIMLFLAIFPKSLDWLSNIIGISYPPALFLTLCVILIMLVLFNFTKKIEKLRKEVTNLEQELSVLKGKNDEK